MELRNQHLDTGCACGYQVSLLLDTPSKQSYAIYTGWDKSKFTVHMENNTVINNNTRVNSVIHVLTTVNLLLPLPVCMSACTHLKVSVYT